MATKLKEELIHLLLSLKHMPKHEEPRIKHLTSRLAKADIVIPSTTKAKEEVVEFLGLLLKEIPTLDNIVNEKILVTFFKKTSLSKVITEAKGPSRTKKI